MKRTALRLKKKGSYTITEADSDNDGENDSVSLRLTINGNSSSYTLESDGDNIILTEGNRKTTLTKNKAQRIGAAPMRLLQFNDDIKLNLTAGIVNKFLRYNIYL